MNEPFHGVVVVDKPVGPTSFDIVRQARRATGARKVGHGGTLDPQASGVLPICFGEATKLAQFLLDA
ncbi:MAG: tRNA pseudouridine(55) synthase TruB, partial [Pseudomonadota bacterium]